jgi:hypothetical protein
MLGRTILGKNSERGVAPGYRGGRRRDDPMKQFTSSGPRRPADVVRDLTPQIPIAYSWTTPSVQPFPTLSVRAL